jgi:hypothetical protein
MDMFVIIPVRELSYGPRFCRDEMCSLSHSFLPSQGCSCVIRARQHVSNPRLCLEEVATYNADAELGGSRGCFREDDRLH